MLSGGSLYLLDTPKEAFYITVVDEGGVRHTLIFYYEFGRLDDRRGGVMESRLD